ncbi:MAG: deoxyribose-phosphate aldolase [Acidilobus sp.]
MAQALSRGQIMGLIDHTLLRPYATLSQVESLVQEAAEFGCYSVCVNLVHVPLVRTLITRMGYRQKVCSVIDFPFGASTTDLRVEAVRRAAAWGADEVDVVAPITLVKSGLLEAVERDVRKVVSAAHQEGLVIKVIVEDAYTTRAEKESLYRIVMESGADFIKTGTGFEEQAYASSIGNQTGARVENVRLMAELSRRYNPQIGIKPAGGIRTVSQILELLEASERPPDPRRFRVGTSSARRIWEELTQGQRM